jgi:hypothetical protein
VSNNEASSYSATDGRDTKGKATPQSASIDKSMLMHPGGFAIVSMCASSPGKLASSAAGSLAMRIICALRKTAR